MLKEHEWYLYRFQKKLRKEENASNIFGKFIYRMSKNILGAKLGIYIPAGVFDEGLHIWHYGNIIVNGNMHMRSPESFSAVPDRKQCRQT